MQNGRTPPALPTLTLPGSGYTVEYRPIGPLMISTLRKTIRASIAKPAVPLNTVTGLDGKKAQEPNEADPDYQVALAAWETQADEVFAERMYQLLARRAITTPPDAVAVQQVRADMAELGVTLPDDDRDVFLEYVLIGSPDDLALLQTSIMRHSQPTSEAIAQSIGDFPDSVSRP